MIRFTGHNRCTYVLDENATSDLLMKTVRFYKSLKDAGDNEITEAVFLKLAEKSREKTASFYVRFNDFDICISPWREPRCNYLQTYYL